MACVPKAAPTHSAATTLLAWCLDESASETAVLPRVRVRNGMRVCDEVDVAARIAAFRPSLVWSPPRPAPQRSGTSPLRRVNH